MDQEILIEELHTVTHDEVEGIRILLKELSPESDLTDEYLQSILESEVTKLYVARFSDTKKIVGVNILVVIRILDRYKGTIEDLIVSSEQRGKGIGRKLLEHAIKDARQLGVETLDLTSKPEREAANKLYQSVGFEKRETNVYRLSLK